MMVILNNKSNLTLSEFKSYQEHLKTLNFPNIDIVLCPSSLNISLYQDSFIRLGSQNVSSYSMGAHTGEISAEQLKDAKVEYCLVGHSERRKEQKETNKDINEKIKQLLKYDITPILCIGETKEERKNLNYMEIINSEIEAILKDIDESFFNKLIIAYEPIWSIGTGVIPTVEEIDEVLSYIKKKVPQATLVYGGSINEDNITNLNKSKEIEGYLIGGLSLKIDNLKECLTKITLY